MVNNIWWVIGLHMYVLYFDIIIALIFSNKKVLTSLRISTPFRPTFL